MSCNDPFVKELKDRGYHLVAYPKTSIKPLHVYQVMEESKLLRLFVKTDLKSTSGFLKDMFDSPSGAIGVNLGNGIGLDTVTTQKVNGDISAKIMTNYLNTLLPADKKLPENQVKALFANTETVVFKIDEIKTVDVNEIALRNWLNDNQPKLRKIYEEDIKDGELYIATSLMKSTKISLTCERTSTASAAAEFANILNLPLAEGKLNIVTDNSQSDKLIYAGKEGIVIGVKVVRLKFSDKGILTIDNKQDINRVLGHNMETENFETSETFIDIE